MSEIQAEYWSDAEIDKCLYTLPGLIDNARQELINQENELKELNHVLRLEIAAAKLEYVRGRKPRPTATEIIAHAELATKATAKLVIAQETSVEKAKAVLKYQQDRFDAAKKAANQKVADTSTFARATLTRDPETNRINYHTNHS
jgi:hypothetical protein